MWRRCTSNLLRPGWIVGLKRALSPSSHAVGTVSRDCPTLVLTPNQHHACPEIPVDGTNPTHLTCSATRVFTNYNLTTAEPLALVGPDAPFLTWPRSGLVWTACSTYSIRGLSFPSSMACDDRHQGSWSAPLGWGLLRLVCPPWRWDLMMPLAMPPVDEVEGLRSAVCREACRVRFPMSAMAGPCTSPFRATWHRKGVSLVSAVKATVSRNLELPWPWQLKVARANTSASGRPGLVFHGDTLPRVTVAVPPAAGPPRHSSAVLWCRLVRSAVSGTPRPGLEVMTWGMRLRCLSNCQTPRHCFPHKIWGRLGDLIGGPVYVVPVRGTSSRSVFRLGSTQSCTEAAHRFGRALDRRVST